MKPIPKVLTIAGSDSAGCAGIQADLKTFAALGVHGMSVVTSVTAQDTRHVDMFSNLPLENIRRQLEVVVEDIGVDVVKTGMLPSADIVDLIADKIDDIGCKCLVVDPVLASGGGDPLVQFAAIEVLKNKLFPRALVVTPNLHEAELLTGIKIENKDQLEEIVKEFLRFGAQSVVIKGGHSEDPMYCIDYFSDGSQLLEFQADRVDTQNTHGSGCTFASAIAAFLSQGLDLKESIAEAKNYVTGAIRHSLSIGHGGGPLGHFWRQHQEDVD